MVDLPGAIYEKLVDPAKIFIEILRPREPVIAQGIFDSGAKYIFGAGGGGRAGREVIARRDGVEDNGTRIAVAAIGDARGSIDKDVINGISKTPAQGAGVIGAAAGKAVGADAEGRVGWRSGECPAPAIAKIVEVRLDAGHKGADLVIVARLEAAAGADTLTAAIWDKVEPRRGKAKRFILWIVGCKPRADIGAQINPGPGEDRSRRGRQVSRETWNRKTSGYSSNEGNCPAQLRPMRQFPFKNERPSILEHVPVLRNASVAAESETQRFVNLVKEALVINASRSFPSRPSRALVDGVYAVIFCSLAQAEGAVLTTPTQNEPEQPSISTSIPARAEFKKALLDLVSAMPRFLACALVLNSRTSRNLPV